MTPVDLLGWTATVVGTVLAAPQLVRLVRTRNVEGLSLLSWQTALVINLAWAIHGANIGQLPQMIASLLALLTTVPILVVMSRTLGRSVVATMLPSLAVAASLVAVDVFLGTGAYGIVAIVPGVVITAAQSVELVRAEHVRGLSPVSMALGFVNITLWITWALLINDAGSVIAVTATWVVACFNTVWYVLRRFGLRPFFAPVAAPVPVGAGEREEARQC
jgi:uncharacterized protein with PQ loop repeat